MNKRLMTTLSAAAASLLLASGTATAAPNAANPAQTTNPPQQQDPATRKERRAALRQRIPIAEGKVQSVDGNTITLQAKRRGDGQGAAITTNAGTAFYVPGVSTPTIADVKAGDRVAILFDQTVSDETAKVASAVSVLPQPASVIVAGEVSGIGASSFTLTGRKDVSGTVTAANAKIIVPGKISATLADLQNGDRAAVQGAPSGDQSMDAALIVVLPDGDTSDNVFGGVIAAVNANTLVVFTPGGEQLSVDASSAVIFQRGETDAAISDLKVGRPVGVIGVRNADGGVTAQLIGQAGLPFFGRWLR